MFHQIDSSSVDSDYEGFVGLVHPKGSFPFTMIEGFKIRPGHLNIIALSGTSVDAVDDIRYGQCYGIIFLIDFHRLSSNYFKTHFFRWKLLDIDVYNTDLRPIDPVDRNCYFPDETEQMKVYKVYSQSNCNFECSVEYAQVSML
jgi:hypothetical protein